ncbi:MAG: outer membrane beta-barrel protein [Draconibacterium sp.]|nr:outer membrane beta-barrel protein [Draconibacterium sp.]
MKKILLVVSLIILGFTAQSQILISLLLGDKLNSEGLEFGLEGGLNLTNISGFDDTKSLGNFNLGFYFDIKMKDQWYFYTGVQVKSNFGMKNLSENDLEFLEADTYEAQGSYNQKLNTFMVPILVNYKFKNRIYIEAGPQMGLVYNSWVEFTSNEDNKDAKIKDYNDNLINWFNAGLAGGVGYKLKKNKGVTVGIRYYQGLTNVFKYRSGTQHNSLHFKVNIPIGAGKEE